MLRLPILRSSALLVFALTLAAAPTIDAQTASGERVLRSWVDDVKLDDGSKARWTFTVTYDAAAGEYARTVVDENGAVIERTTSTTSLARPSDEEIEMARRVIFGDAELNELYERAANPELSGGFILQREAGHPCGPGSRCLQFDMFDVDTLARRVNRIRYVIVNARNWTMVSNDFNPSTDGNATRFNGNPDPTR